MSATETQAATIDTPPTPITHTSNDSSNDRPFLSSLRFIPFNAVVQPWEHLGPGTTEACKESWDAIERELSEGPSISLITSEVENPGPSMITLAGGQERLSKACYPYLEIINMNFHKWRANHFIRMERKLRDENVPLEELQLVMAEFKTRIRHLSSTSPLTMLPARTSSNFVVRDLVLRNGLEPPPDYPMPNLPVEDTQDWKMALSRGKVRYNLGLTGTSKAVSGAGEHNGWRKQDWVFRNYARANPDIDSFGPDRPVIRKSGSFLAAYLGASPLVQTPSVSGRSVPKASRFGAVGDGRPKH